MNGAWFALGGALLATAIGQVMFKLFFRRHRYIWLATAIGFFAIAPVCNYLALQTLGIGMVYMSTALTIVLVVGLSRLILGERLSRDHGIATILIVCGVLIYAL